MLKIGVIIMAIFGFLYAGFWSHLFNSRTPPVKIPIDFSIPNYVGKKMIEIDEDKTYVIGLGFSITDPKEDNHKDHYKMDLFLNGVDRDNLKIDGAYNIGKGTDIPFKIIIKDIQTNGKSFYFEHEYMTTKKDSEATSSRIAGTIDLTQGKYLVQVIVTKAFSKLKGEDGYIIINNLRKRK